MSFGNLYLVPHHRANQTCLLRHPHALLTGSTQTQFFCAVNELKVWFHISISLQHRLIYIETTWSSSLTCYAISSHQPPLHTRALVPGCFPPSIPVKLLFSFLSYIIKCRHTNWPAALKTYLSWLPFNGQNLRHNPKRCFYWPFTVSFIFGGLIICFFRRHLDLFLWQPHYGCNILTQKQKH